MANSLTFTVGELNSFVKRLLEYEQVLNGVKVKGEISNLSVSSAGHVYFTLKDEDAALRCVWFHARKGQSLDELKDGRRIIVKGTVSLYVRSGDYQLIVKEIELAGSGYWYERFLKLKKKLENEGLFDVEQKKPLPLYPKAIGVVTSGSGAAIEDIKRIINERYPIAKVILYPVAVQGQYAANEIAKAIGYFSKKQESDVLIVGRGGGSIEDLWPFNEEIVARSVHECSIPVVSAVGHESDFTICDFVADVREATPSSAAVRVTPDRHELANRLTYAKNKLYQLQSQRLLKESDGLRYLASRLHVIRPDRILTEKSQRLDYATQRLMGLSTTMLTEHQMKLNHLQKVLVSLSPQKTLSRGYTMVEDEQGNIISTAHVLRQNQAAKVIFHDGSVAVKTMEE